MRTTIAFVLVSVAISLAMLAAAPGNFHNFERHNSPARNEGILSTGDTRSPIRHLIVVVGENRSFDNVFDTYMPSDPSQTIWNLLSQGIVLNNGTPGPQLLWRHTSRQPTRLPMSSVQLKQVPSLICRSQAQRLTHFRSGHALWPNCCLTAKRSAAI